MDNYFQWLENMATLEKDADTFFSRRQSNQGMDFNTVLAALGLPESNTPPTVIGQGSLATVYQHPDPNKVIKVTGDVSDARNLKNAQRLRSRNVLKVYQVVKVGPKAFAIVADKVAGAPMPYTSNVIAALIDGDSMDDALEASEEILNPTGVRLEILRRMGKLEQTEIEKLSELFRTIGRLERMGIDMFDYTDNVLDAGSHYVIVDMGQ